MSQTRQDRPDAQIVGPASMLATALNLAFDGSDVLAEHAAKFCLARCSGEKASTKANLWPLSQAIFVSIISWYHEAVNCLVQVQQEPRHLLAYVSLPGRKDIDFFLSFVDLYNDALNELKSHSSKPKSTLQKAASMCDAISLDTGEPTTSCVTWLYCLRRPYA